MMIYIVINSEINIIIKRPSIKWRQTSWKKNMHLFRDLNKNITKGENMIIQIDILMYNHFVNISGYCTTKETDSLFSFPSDTS